MPAGGGDGGASWRVCDESNGGLESKDGKKENIGKDKEVHPSRPVRGERIKVVPKEFLTPQEQLPVYGMHMTKGIGDAGLKKTSTQMRLWLLALPYK